MNVSKFSEVVRHALSPAGVSPAGIRIAQFKDTERSPGKIQGLFKGEYLPEIAAGNCLIDRFKES